MKRSRAQANFIVKNLPNYIIVEVPKEKRTSPIVSAEAPKKSHVLTATEETKEPEILEEELSTLPDFTTMGRIELDAYIKAAKTPEQVEPLTTHDLKTIREAAIKKLAELKK